VDAAVASSATVLVAGVVLASLMPTLLGALVGIVAGGLVLLAVKLFSRIRATV
jgi:predicted DNA repair protein MutK